MEQLNEKNNWILLGSGQFGQVFKGIYKQKAHLSIQVAIKVNVFFFILQFNSLKKINL